MALVLTQRTAIPNQPTNNSTGRAVAWSPDNTMLVFGLFSFTGEPYVKAYSISGTTATLISPSPVTGGTSVTSVRFNPAGTLLSITHANGSGAPQVSIFSVSGTTFTRLSNLALPAVSNLGVTMGEFSPDGSLYVVTHNRVSANGNNAFTMFTVSGTTFTAVAPPALADMPASHAWDAAFSPDGSMLAITAQSLFVNGDFAPTLFLYSVSGSTLTRLPSPAVMPTLTNETVLEACFSPDGQYFATADTRFNGVIHVWSVSGTTFTFVTNPTPNDFNAGLDWSPDSALLARGKSVYESPTFVSSTTWSPVAPATMRHGHAFSLDGTVLAVASGGTPYLSWWNVAAPAVIGGWLVGSVAIS